MRTSYRIFLNNKIDLDLYLKEVDQSFSEPSTTEWANRKKQGILITNIFNLLTSAQSLREVLREKNEKYCPISTDSLIFYFYREIRNLIVHHCSFPLITKGKLKDEDGTRTFIYHQTIDKPVFLEFLNKKKEDFNKKGRHKQEGQIDLVVNFIANMADEIIFESLLLSYYESTIDFYKQWLRKFVKLNGRALTEYSAAVWKIHHTAIYENGQRISNLPINQFQARWLRMWISYSGYKNKN